MIKNATAFEDDFADFVAGAGMADAFANFGDTKMRVSVGPPAVDYSDPAAPLASRLKLAPSDGADRYGEWTVDVASVEGRGEPLVFLGESPGAGTGVFAAERLEAGQTITEFVGCLAPTPATRCDEMELQQSFYGSDWRTYSQSYEIGLSGARSTFCRVRLDRSKRCWYSTLYSEKRAFRKRHV